MNILEKIILHKEQEVAIAKERVPTSTLEKSPFFDRKVFSFSEALKANPFGIISEFKRQSPSKGIINDTVIPEVVVKGYIENGASAVSILTDKFFFGGTIEDVKKARPLINAPILRKDFIIDEYQLLAFHHTKNVKNPTKIDL